MLDSLRQRGIQVAGCDVFEEMSVNGDWSKMIERLRQDTLEMKRDNTAVVGIGHSFGGALMLCAQSVYPDLFSKLFLFDPPVFQLGKPLSRAHAHTFPRFRFLCRLQATTMHNDDAFDEGITMCYLACKNKKLSKLKLE
jgi:pimeloyl-ACP methyl ester carboxylesterase